MVEDDDEPVAFQPVRKRDAAVRDGFHRRSRFGTDQPAVAGASIGQIAAVTHLRTTGQRLEQTAFALGERLCGIKAIGNVGEDVAQAFEQARQRLFVAPERLETAVGVLVAGIQFSHEGAAGFTHAFQFGDALRLFGAAGIQCFALGADLLHQFGQLGQLGQQGVDAVHPVALEIAVVGHHPRQRLDAILGQQQLQLLVPTKGIGRAQQGSQRFALFAEALFHRGAFGLQALQLGALLFDAGIDVAQRAAFTIHTLVGFAQRSCGIATLGIERVAYRRQLGDLLAHGNQLALCLSFTRGTIFLRGYGEGRDERQQCRQNDHA